ncbi:FAD/NAD(P)-binding domain-containing protein [Coemansia reversa NRRL 1564]|uniref:FAD/NAD(P)-binding domain-containing protein n=1 Tax=Coemansia reversa (strain ATCC 12441 / NRRL 1564) TaxID=763665 RepID=A0A2G5B8Q3_COERN|nr:FAD/NAD(P)-binding domain-containing protein [Coemansia reversa NRRL 1564]|eukprot:PIA15370.1 FAD/NAD(P)-binding domain-containing protein [Coemansia reversa NRRL 1564]
MSTRDIHVVVVGISTAGIAISKAIAALAKKGRYPGLHVTIVDRNAYWYYMIGAPRAVVDKQFGHQLFFRQDTLLTPFEVDPLNPKHRFIQASLVAVNSDKSIELSNGEKLSFDYLLLSTGATNSFPANVIAPSLEDARSRLLQLHDNVKNAESVLVIGGGAVGVETAGEIASEYPKKKVTLVHSGARLLPSNFKAGLSDGAVRKLRRLGVAVVLNERMVIPADTPFDGTIRPLSLKGKSGNTYDSELQFLTIGPKIHTEYLVSLEEQLDTKLREANGAIRIKPTFQIDHDQLTAVFAVGDVNSLPAGNKYAMKAVEQAQVAAANVITMIEAGFDQNPKDCNVSLEEWDGSEANMIVVPMGRNLGVAQVAGIAFGRCFVGNFLARNVKGKDYFLAKNATEFPPGANA